MDQDPLTDRRIVKKMNSNETLIVSYPVCRVRLPKRGASPKSRYYLRPLADLTVWATVGRIGVRWATEGIEVLDTTRITSNSISFDIPTGSRWDTYGVASCVARLGDDRRSEAEPRGGHKTFMRMRAAARLPAGRHAFEVADIGRVPA